MRAIDSNGIVDSLTTDDREPPARAAASAAQGDIFVATSVVREGERVLHSGYGVVGPGRRCVRAFAGLPGIAAADATLTARALDQAEWGWTSPTRFTSRGRATARRS